MSKRHKAALLAFFLGGFGVQWIYLGSTTKFVLSLIFFWTSIPAWIALYHTCRFLLITDEQFEDIYMPKQK